MKVEKGYYLTTGGCVIEIKSSFIDEMYPHDGIIMYLNMSCPERTWTDILGDHVSFTDGGLEFDEGKSWLDLEEKISIESHPEYFI